MRNFISRVLACLAAALVLLLLTTAAVAFHFAPMVKGHFSRTQL